MKKSLINERKLMDELESRYKLSVADAVALLDVSEATVRRIFNSLEKEPCHQDLRGHPARGRNAVRYSFERLRKNRRRKRSLLQGMQLIS